MKIKYRTFYYDQWDWPKAGYETAHRWFMNDGRKNRPLKGYYRRIWIGNHIPDFGTEWVDAYFLDGKLHRVDGPAFERHVSNNGPTGHSCYPGKEWWCNGVRFDESSWTTEEEMMWAVLSR